MSLAKPRVPRRPPVRNRPSDEEMDQSMNEALGQASRAQNETYEDFFKQDYEDEDEENMFVEAPTDEHGVAIESLPKEISCGLSLNTPGRVKASPHSQHLAPGSRWLYEHMRAF
eukprot:6253031-Pyramimonas_sp.AAC.1